MGILPATFCPGFAAAALGNALAVAEGSRRSPGAWLAPDVKAWFASPQQGLVADIESLQGPDAVTDALGRLAPSALSVVGVVSADDACWAEITRRGDREPAETCVVGLTYDADGAVSRLVCYVAFYSARRIQLECLIRESN